MSNLRIFVIIFNLIYLIFLVSITVYIHVMREYLSGARSVKRRTSFRKVVGYHFHFFAAAAKHSNLGCDRQQA
jgi:hypothetical protein